MNAVILTPAEIAQRILQLEGSPLHVNDIATKAIECGLAPPEQLETLASKLSSTLSQSLKSKRKQSPFRKIRNAQGKFRRGIYSLRQRSGISQNRHRKLLRETLAPIGSGYTGKAGEYAVFSELLFRGFNASIMTVDDGVDIVTSKNSRFFFIQVKTASDSGKGFSFTVRKSSFDAYSAVTTFYVLVTRRVIANRHISDFVVLPWSFFKNLIDRRVLGDGGSYSLRISISKDGEYALNKTENVTTYVNNFGQIT